MRNASRIAALALSALIAAIVLAGCSASTPPETPAASELDAAIATATTAVANASTYIFTLEQELPGAPSNEQLEKLQSTLNLAATQTGATQRATAQSALDQFDAGIEQLTEAYNAAPEGSDEQQQLQQLIGTLAVGREALSVALE
jgi:hypothetical protein